MIENHTSFKVIIRNHQDVLYEGEVTALSSINGSGKFDILAQHANFISLIEKYITLYPVGKPTETMKITSGVIEVEDEVARVYLEN